MVPTPPSATRSAPIRSWEITHETPCVNLFVIGTSARFARPDRTCALPAGGHMSRIQYPERIPLANTPTPLERLERFGARLGVELWCKRDDLTGAELSGNK